MKRHPLDVLSLAFGLIFLVVSAMWIMGRTTTIYLPDAGWIIAGALILAGLFGIVATIRGVSRSDTTATPAYLPPPAYEQPTYPQPTYDPPAAEPERPARFDDGESATRPEDRGL